MRKDGGSLTFFARNVGKDKPTFHTLESENPTSSNFLHIMYEIQILADLKIAMKVLRRLGSPTEHSI